MGFASWDEHELVRRCKEGSEAAYAELVRRHRQRLVNLAFRLTGSRETAEDVAQEAFIAAFRTIERFEPKPSLSAWLNTITVRLAGKVASKRAAAPATSLDHLLSPDAVAGSAGSGSSGGTGDSGAMAGLLASTDATLDPHAAAEAAEVRREIGAALSGIPFKYRTAVALRFVAGLDYAEAAQTMDVPLNTYKSHLLRGTRQLREALGPRLAVGEGGTAAARGAPVAGATPVAAGGTPVAGAARIAAGTQVAAGTATKGERPSPEEWPPSDPHPPRAPKPPGRAPQSTRRARQSTQPE